MKIFHFIISILYMTWDSKILCYSKHVYKFKRRLKKFLPKFFGLYFQVRQYIAVYDEIPILDRIAMLNFEKNDHEIQL